MARDPQRLLGAANDRQKTSISKKHHATSAVINTIKKVVSRFTTTFYIFEEIFRSSVAELRRPIPTRNLFKGTLALHLYVTPRSGRGRRGGWRVYSFRRCHGRFASRVQRVVAVRKQRFWLTVTKHDEGGGDLKDKTMTFVQT